MNASRVGVSLPGGDDEAQAFAGTMSRLAAAIGAVAGLYPAVRAARLAPTDALRSV